MQDILKSLNSPLPIYQSLFENNPNPCYATDTNGNFVLFNDAATNLLGYSRDEALSSNYLSMVKEESRENTLARFQEVLQGSKVFAETLLLHKDGKELDVYVTAVPIVAEGSVAGMIGVTQDITDQKKIQQELLESRNQIRNIMDSIDVCIWSWDVQKNQPLAVSSACWDIFGYTQEEMLGSNDIWSEVYHSDDRYLFREKERKLQKSETTRLEYRVIHRTKGVKWVSDYSVPIFDEAGNLIRIDGVITDIDQRKKAELQLKHQAFHDPLTELPNRRMLHANLEQTIQQNRHTNGRIALFYLDLDRFKYVNDSLGHQQGDQLLQLVAKRMMESLPQADMITRQGGDEFVVLVENIARTEDVIGIARKMLHVIEQPLKLGDQKLTLTTSIGISIYPDHADNADDLLSKADQAMYLAKEKGKSNFQIYESGLSRELSRTMMLEQGLHQALNNKEMELYYQPIVNAQTSNIVGFEALARWNNHALGWISPGEFIPIAEASGLISVLGDWILTSAIRQCKNWNDSGHLVYVTVNVSAKQLESDYFIDRLKKTLDEYNLSPSLLKLEITESTAMSKVDDKVMKLKQIEKLGIDILLDDFGTGYSSLSYLKKFPITTLKIDQSFVAGIEKDTGQEAIIRAIIAMAESLRISIVAEGVENVSHLSFLADHGCTLMQGYLFNRPVSATDAELILKEGRNIYPESASLSKQE